MNKTTCTIIIFSLFSFFSLGQTTRKTTYLDLLKTLAEKQHLKLSYSNDLLALSDSTDFIFSTNPDSCLTELQNQTSLKISKTETHLVVASKAPAYIHLQGKVVDAKSGELLPYANILIEKAGTGTISNTNGEFDFKIQGRYTGSEVKFSFMGYGIQKLKIPFADNDELLIKLTPKPYTLADVFVLPNGNEALDIVKRAVKNIKRNYDRNTHQMKAFYRNTNYRDTTATQLIEAALLIEDKGIMHPTSTTKIELEEIRKSTNYQIPMKIKHKAALKIMEKYFGGHRNTFYRTYSNYVRIYRDEWWYQPLTDYETFKYEFAGFEWLDSIKVYKIKFIYDRLQPDGKRASENKYSDNGGFIYINSEDWAILKIEKWWKIFSGHPNQNMAIKGDYVSKDEMGYQKINGKYYLKYTSGHASPNGEYFVYENPDAPNKEKLIKQRQYAETTLLITKVITNKKEMDKIRYREKLAKNENSYETNYPYNPSFWKNYNILKENPLEEKFVNEMEWEKSLDIQFEENSSNNVQDK
nr:carboxypeptidase-like regulatory domain-containing protein [uncultured Draconibacterium sp.]